VVLGGLSLSAVLTLLIIPPLLSLVSAVVERGRNVDGKESVQAAE
jgi:Flp pilus assembly protein TadG